jgi:cytoskeleton protein RodZ
VSESDNQASGTVVPGAALAAAREALNLSVAEVARQLKLSVSQIEALEEGAYQKLPGPVFVRGFIRNYARLLRLDPEEMLRSVEPSLPPQPAGEEVPPSRDIPFPPAKTRWWPWYAAGMLLLIGGLAVYEFYWNEPEFTVSKRAPAPRAVEHGRMTAGPTVTPSAIVEPAPAVRSAPITSAAPDASVSQDTKVADSKAADKPQPATAAVDENLPGPGERLLHLVFDEESWVEIRDAAGNVIFSQLNQAGSERRIYGRPPLSLIVGNAHGVRLTYNEQPVDLERHTKVDVARFTLE